MNIAMSREKLLEEVWGFDFYGDDRTVDTHIKMLRNSLGPYRDLIVTLRGMGYNLTTLRQKISEAGLSAVRTAIALRLALSDPKSYDMALLLGIHRGNTHTHMAVSGSYHGQILRAFQAQEDIAGKR